MQEQLYSNLIGLHVTVGSDLTEERLRDYANVWASRSSGTAEAYARATALLAREVQKRRTRQDARDGTFGKRR
jgi:hypothetical protein